MKYKIITDNKNRRLFRKNELKYISLKLSIRLNQKLKIKNCIKFFDIQKNDIFTKIKNRCFLSNRSKSIYKKFRVSRIKFRELVINGNYPGLIKSSW